jgi:hypothetical protein
VPEKQTAEQRYRAKPETKLLIKKRDAKRHEDKMKKLCGDDYVVGERGNKTKVRKVLTKPIIPPLGAMLYFANPDPLVAAKSASSKTAASREANRHKPCSKGCGRPRSVSKEGVCTSTMCRECRRVERDRLKRSRG